VWWAALSSAFFLLVTQPGQTAQPVFWLITGILFLAIAVSDQYYGVIPLPFVWIGVILTLGYRLILIMTGTYMPMDLVWSVVAAGVLSGFYLLLRVITRGAGMGEGDVWLAIYLGLVMGWTRILTGTMVAFVGGSIVGIVLIMFKLKTRKETIPFGPFMVLGAIASLIWG
jgi:leader peptidase (prepilin peptidase)/N-methyltransferase